MHASILLLSLLVPSSSLALSALPLSMVVFFSKRFSVQCQTIRVTKSKCIQKSAVILIKFHPTNKQHTAKITHSRLIHCYCHSLRAESIALAYRLPSFARHSRSTPSFAFAIHHHPSARSVSVAAYLPMPIIVATTALCPSPSLP